MQVFKAYFKIIKRHFLQLMIYVLIFFGLAALFSISPNNVGGNTDFTQEKQNIAIINRDENSALIQGFTDYLSQNATIIPLEDSEEALKDALFFRQVKYIVTIPKNFTTDFMGGKESTVYDDAVPDSSEAIYLNQMTNQYFNTAQLYKKSLSDATQETIVSKTATSLASTTRTTLDKTSIESDIPPYGFYFSFLPYAMICVVTLGVTSIMIVFNNPDMKHRNTCAPIRLRNFNFQLTLATTVYGLTVWAVSIIAAFLLYDITAESLPLVLMCGLNALLMTFVSISIAFLIGMFIQNYNIQNAITNVIALGLSFLSGVFVSQDLLSDTINTIASFNPVYWYIKNNDAILSLNNFTSQSLEPIFTGMLVIVGFIIAIFGVALMISKYQQAKRI